MVIVATTHQAFRQGQSIVVMPLSIMHQDDDILVIINCVPDININLVIKLPCCVNMKISSCKIFKQ